MALPSWSTTRIGIFATSASELRPWKMNPKNDAMAMGMANGHDDRAPIAPENLEVLPDHRRQVV
jgi:hypothetical protein